MMPESSVEMMFLVISQTFDKIFYKNTTFSAHCNVFTEIYNQKNAQSREDSAHLSQLIMDLVPKRKFCAVIVNYNRTFSRNLLSKNIL